MVFDDLAGSVEVVFDCTTDDSVICAAQDMRLSPNAIFGVFSVAYGEVFYSNLKGMEPIEFKATRYHLMLYNRLTKEVTVLDRNARMGEWCGNDCLLFASNRAGIYPPLARGGADFPDVGLHIYRASFDSNTKDLGPAFDLTPAAAHCMSPAVNPNGTVTFSCWEGDGDRTVTSTPANHYWIFECQSNGIGCRSIIGAHSPGVFHTRKYLAGVCDPARCGEGGTTSKLPRGYVMLPSGLYAYISYYRSNHLGMMGVVMVCKPSDVEGFSQSKNVPDLAYPSSHPGSANFSPDCYVATPYGTDQDAPVKRDKQGRPMGKAGYPFAVPERIGLYGFTHCRGVCYYLARPEETFPENLGGEPASKREIRVALVPRITNPFDPRQSKVIACPEQKWNCWDARWVAAYQDIYGQPEPDPAPELLEGATTTLVVENARKGELQKMTWHTNYKPYWDCVKQGCADPDWAKKIAAIRITEILPWYTKPTRQGPGGIGRVWEFPLEPNGSVLMQFPCKIRYRLEGIDSDGVVVAQDKMTHPAVCGEVRSCKGCHEAHSEERAAEYD